MKPTALRSPRPALYLCVLRHNPSARLVHLLRLPHPSLRNSTLVTSSHGHLRGPSANFRINPSSIQSP